MAEKRSQDDRFSEESDVETDLMKKKKKIAILKSIAASIVENHFQTQKV